MTMPDLERAIVAVLKMMGDADGDLADRILDRYLMRFGADVDAKHAALRRLEAAMTADGDGAEVVQPARASR